MPIKPILHLPHASNIIPDKTGYLVTEEKLQQEILLLTDWHTDELFYYKGAIPIVAEFSRVFCDVERFADDEREVMAKVGMSATYTKCDDGSDLRIVSPELRQHILSKYYQPHHQKLRNIVTEQLESSGRAIILDCHSFTSKPFNRDINKEMPRPDICIGTDDYHTPDALIKFTKTYFEFAGYTVVINNPYSGSMVPMEYYQMNNRVHSIMIELNRDLYLVAGTNKKGRGYIKTKRVINTYLHKVSELMYCDYPDLNEGEYSIPQLPPQAF